MLEPLYHKRYSHIMTVVDGSIFNNNLRETEENIIFAQVLQ